MSKIPKLRFPEFSGEWEEKRLEELGGFFKGTILSKSNLSNNGTPCILYGELYTKYNEVITKIFSKTSLKEDKLFWGKKNDVLIPSSGETAIDIATASCLQEDNVLLGGDLNVFRPHKVNGIFISYQLSNSKKSEIAKIAQGASVVHIYNEQLKKLILNVPKEEEQKKIASFFSILDKKIEKQQEKVQSFEKYKKGMMQKIFNQEIRFKDEDGKDYLEWVEKKLYTAVDFINGKAHEKDIGPLGKYIVVNSKFISSNGQIYKRCTKNLCPLKKNDIVFVMSDVPNGKALAKCYLIKYDDKYTLNQRICLLRSKKNINSVYLYFLLNRNAYFLKFDDGISQTNLKKSDVLNCPILFPVIQEQQKIANFFSTLDKKVQKEQEKLDKLNEVKKGLLQQMFV